MVLSLKSLVAKFDGSTRDAMEGAAGLCVSGTHYQVEIEHFLVKALEQKDADLHYIFRHFEVDSSKLVVELRKSLDRLKTGNTRGPSFSPMLVTMFSEAWSIATLNYADTRIRTGHVLLALLANDEMLRLLREISREMKKISLEVLSEQFEEITTSSIEIPAEVPVESGSNGSKIPRVTSATPFLQQYTTNLTQNAREGKLDAVIGRNAEIRQMIDVLMRKRQNNPILTGEAGVGKTAVVEGLAARIAAGEVPPALQNVQLHALDLALLHAGAGVKGEFENRLKGLIQEVKSSPQPVILFIDEAHTMIGAGGPAGQGDAANLLKPALARGELRTIAATTWSEYKRYFEKDAALARRFQVVHVQEPSEERCVAMLRGLLPALELHHGVRIMDDALIAAVRLSHRYMPGRQLPDKAVSVLDTACARVGLSLSAAPSALEEIMHRIATLESQERVLLREQATGSSHKDALLEITTSLEGAKGELREMQARWAEERDIVDHLHVLRAKLEGTEIEATLRETTLRELATAKIELFDLQQGKPLTYVGVDQQIVGEVISEWTGIPLGKMLADEVSRILDLEDSLKKRVIGQDHAMKAIAQRVQTSRANLDDPSKPIGVFLLAGPSGVGKTETALALTDLLYGGEQNLITINMSEFHEPHSVSTLKGAPPGYVGYGEGGVLTEAVRRQPYSVVLLDEAEKAHPEVLELFFQVFDKGYMEDGEGRGIDFRNTLILLTTNTASGIISKLAEDPHALPAPLALASAIRPELNRVFKPALLGRMLVVPYYPVQDEVLERIIRLKLNKIQARLMANHHIALDYDESLLTLIRQRCMEVETGARNVDHLISNTILPEISKQLLERMAEEDLLESIWLGVSENGAIRYEWTILESDELVSQA
ncbi:type VI secretion system ATPase TssH [Terriglobus saanensis]|uniref:Type VI secretion ATPase, ClpV1 family n=1 Tax=Terriglobus saanensis (strain ATCC BAA-1853 / DSM 23119 / SP1PR4) TaxID=401053 RepID=E8UX33_TERSS|nr:type VI secretion system ATPase TssH [Terriglobus saanensis]ADV81920.1 type VI secretion ATPase, ClpV1 family [Terriglobus saanensis SP1PR4]